MSTIRKLFEGLGFTKRSIDVIIASWREGTASQYQTYLQKWFAFCKQRNCDVISPPLPMAVDFLSMLYEKGFSYSTVRSFRLRTDAGGCLRKKLNTILKSQIDLYRGKAGRSSKIPFMKRLTIGSCPNGREELTFNCRIDDNMLLAVFTLKLTFLLSA